MYYCINCKKIYNFHCLHHSISYFCLSEMVEPAISLFDIFDTSIHTFTDAFSALILLPPLAFREEKKQLHNAVLWCFPWRRLNGYSHGPGERKHPLTINLSRRQETEEEQLLSRAGNSRKLDTHGEPLHISTDGFTALTPDRCAPSPARASLPAQNLRASGRNCRFGLHLCVRGFAWERVKRKKLVKEGEGEEKNRTG